MKEIGKPVTPSAVPAAIAKLTELKGQGEDPAEVINRSTLGGWPTFWPKDRGRDGGRNGQAAPAKPLSPTDIPAWVTRLEWFRFGSEDQDPDLTLPVGYWDAATCGPKPGEKGARIPEDAIKEFARRHPARAVK